MRIRFTEYPHTVMAVPCPTCSAGTGAGCHRTGTAGFHSERIDAAARIFHRQHGPRAAIYHSGDDWEIAPDPEPECCPPNATYGVGDAPSRSR